MKFKRIENIIDITGRTSTSHDVYCLLHKVMSFIDYETESNGFSDDHQLLIYRVDGKEIGRSEKGIMTMTAFFDEIVKELFHKIIYE